ncbi:MAG: kelch repeat-containing protein, partial [Anaerolineales bacterium]
MKDTRTASLVVNLILILLISTACQPPQPAAPAPTDAVPVAVAVQPTPTKAPPTATTAPTETPAPTDTPEPTEIPALNPSARGYVSMVYDSESDKIILFGGYDEPKGGGEPIPNGDTWAYDVATNTWTEMKPASGPPANGGTYLVYDIESDRVILFNAGWYN